MKFIPFMVICILVSSSNFASFADQSGGFGGDAASAEAVPSVKNTLPVSTKNGFTIKTDSLPASLEKKFPKSKYVFQSKKMSSFSKDMTSKIKSYSSMTGVSDYGVYVKDLKTGVIFGINDTKSTYEKAIKGYEGYFNGASVAKLFMSFSVYKLAEAGYVDLDKALIDKYTGYKFTIRNEVKKALIYSNNDSYCRVIRAVGPKNVTAVLKHFEISNCIVYGELGPADSFVQFKTNLERYGFYKVGSKVNPAGAGRILEIMYREDMAGNKNTKELISSMKSTIYSGRIPQGLGYKYPVAHKTGSIDRYGIHHDAGIVYTPKRAYIVVVFTNNVPKNGLPNTFIRDVAYAANKNLLSFK